MDYTELILNVQPQKARRETLNGVKYLVAPTVILREGVFDGSDGPGFYPGPELAKSTIVWNHKPVVVYHPTTKNGRKGSATNPVALEVDKIGIVLNTGWQDKLSTEIWAEEEKTRRTDERVYNALDRGEMLEVSTGLAMDRDMVKGVWNGEPYDWTGRNHRPEHLAILPDRPGACSIKHGCGCLQTNEAPTSIDQWQKQQDVRLDLLPADEGPATVARPGGVLVTNEAVSHKDVARGLAKALQAEMKNATGRDFWPGYVEDVYDEFFVYSNGDRYYKRGYTVDDKGGVALSGKDLEVRKHTEYRTTKTGRRVAVKDRHATGTLNQGDPMTTPATPPVENAGGKPAQNPPAPQQPTQQPPASQPATPPGPPPVQTPAPAAPAQTPAPPGPPPVQHPAFTPAQGVVGNQRDNELLGQLSPPMQAMLRHSLEVFQAERGRLIQAVTANAGNKFTPEQLQVMDHPTLQAVAALAGSGATQSQQQPTFNYGGAWTAAPIQNAQPVTQKALPKPSLFPRKAAGTAPAPTN